ncbi:MAG: ABC transporter permease subunit [Acidobacteriota bacterium]
MIWNISKKEFLSSLLTFKFLIGLLLCVLLIPISINLSLVHYLERLKIYQQESQKYEKEFKEIYVYSQIRPTVLKKPEPLSIFISDSEEVLGNKVKILLGQVPFLAEGSATERENPFLASFLNIDFTFICSVLLSLFALLFTYDSFSKEKESGTLATTLANNISRDRLIVGKLLGHVLTLLPIILLSFIVSFLVILVHRSIEFKIEDWLRILSISLSSLLYVLIFLLLGMFISTLTSRSSTSLMIALFIWVFLVIIVPNASLFLSQSLTSIIPKEAIDKATKNLNEEFGKKVKNFEEKLPKPVMGINWLYIGGIDGQTRMISPKDVMENRRQLNSFSEPLRIEYAQRKYAIQQNYLNDLIRQSNLTKYLSIISPLTIFRHIASGLTRTDLESHLQFIEKCKRYREQIINYYMSKNLFSSFAYFTQMKESEMRTADEWIAYYTEGKYKTYRELESVTKGNFFRMFAEFKYGPIDILKHLKSYLDVNDILRFSLKNENYIDTLQRISIDLIVLIIIVVILFSLSYVATIRYDPRYQ